VVKSLTTKASEEGEAENGRPILSLILCSRNDDYMGNSRWRLETTLNYVTEQIEALRRAKDVEVIVADWGSEVPLRSVLQLIPAAVGLVSLIHVPPDLARLLQEDSPFPEVLALNAAARRARGTYIGRIDQDTLVGRRFLQIFFDLHEQRRQIEAPLESTLLFSNVRMVPYRFAARFPPLPVVKHFIDRFGSRLKVELTSRKPFYWHSVGIWLLPRTLWDECGGYDEAMLYMNDMEINMIHRLMQKYKLVNLGSIVGYDFYHLEHYHPWVPRRSSVYRKVNADHRDRREIFHPNKGGWGLAEYSLEMDPYLSVGCASPCGWRLKDELQFTLLLLLVGAQAAWDMLIVRLVVPIVNVGRRWNGRRRKAWPTMSREPMHRWPSTLVELWRTRGGGT
jgi:hypothetical protein